MNKSFVCYSVRLLDDERLLQSHLSLVFALFITWAKIGYPKRFRITRREMMIIAKIGSISTYHRCINDLVKFDYIGYNPSYDHFEGTQVSLKL